MLKSEMWLALTDDRQKRSQESSPLSTVGHQRHNSAMLESCTVQSPQLRRVHRDSLILWFPRLELLQPRSRHKCRLSCYGKLITTQVQHNRWSTWGHICLPRLPTTTSETEETFLLSWRESPSTQPRPNWFTSDRASEQPPTQQLASTPRPR